MMFEVPGTEGKVLRLRKALYGLKQSARVWYKIVSAAFEELHLIRSEADFSVYYGRVGTAFIIIYIHIDDVTLVSNSTPRLKAIKQELNGHFRMVDMWTWVTSTSSSALNMSEIARTDSCISHKALTSQKSSSASR